MHAIKEAIIAREHDKEAEVSFSGWISGRLARASRSTEIGGPEAGIQYIRSRVAEITEDRIHIPSSGTKIPRSGRSSIFRWTW